MVIISKTILAEFGAKYPDAAEALNKWYDESKQADWCKIKIRNYENE